MPASTPQDVWFLRPGRKRRAHGTVLERESHTGCVKVDARHPYGAPVWVTPAEIEAAKEKKQPQAGHPERAIEKVASISLELKEHLDSQKEPQPCPHCGRPMHQS